MRGTELEDAVRAALKSTNLDWLLRMHRYVGIQDLGSMQASRTVFREPTPGDVAGDVLVGYTVPSGIPVGLWFRDFRGHVFVSGRSGVGKSALTWLIASQVVASKTVTIFDIEEEYATLAADSEAWLLMRFQHWRRNHFVGPLALAGADWLERLTGVLEEAFGLTPLSMAQFRAFVSGMREAGDSLTWPALLEHLRPLAMRSASHKALYYRILNLLSSYGDQYGVTTGYALRDVLGRPLILGLKNVSADQRLFLYADLYSYHTAAEDVKTATALNGIWIFDEYHSLMDAAWRDKEPLSFKMLRQISKRGTGLVVCEQSPATLDARARTNYATRCFFSQRDRTNINYAVDSLDLSQAQREFYKWLPPRHYIMQHPRVSFPFVVRVPDLAIRQPSRDEIERRIQRSLEVLGFSQADARAQAGARPAHRTGLEPADDLLTYLRAIVQYPNMPATDRDKQIGIGPAKAAALRRQALAEGLVERVSVNPGGRGKAFLSLSLTAKGRTALGLP